MRRTKLAVLGAALLLGPAGLCHAGISYFNEPITLSPYLSFPFGSEVSASFQTTNAGSVSLPNQYNLPTNTVKSLYSNTALNAPNPGGQSATASLSVEPVRYSVPGFEIAGWDIPHLDLSFTGTSFSHSDNASINSAAGADLGWDGRSAFFFMNVSGTGELGPGASLVFRAFGEISYPLIGFDFANKLFTETITTPGPYSFNEHYQTPLPPSEIGSGIGFAVTATIEGGQGTFHFDPLIGIGSTPTSAAPEPSTLVMSSILLGMFGVIWAYKRMRQTAFQI